MNHCFYIMVLENLVQFTFISNIDFIQMIHFNRRLMATLHIVYNDDFFILFLKIFHRMAAYVASSTSY